MSIYYLLAIVAKHCPKTIIRLRYFKSLHKTVNLNGNFSKIPNLGTYVLRSAIHNRDNRRWALMADKYAVRKEVARIIGEKYLIPLYGHWSHPEDIDFDSLPDSYVLKTNNGCGTNFIINKESKVDRRHIVATMRKALSFPYPELSGQLHYSLIPPCIIAERLMVQGNGRKSLTDYKIHCVNGIPQAIFVFRDRDEVDHFNFNVKPYTTKWQIIPPGSTISAIKDSAPVAPDRPKCLDHMLKLAAHLSEGEEYVRVDFYIIGEQIYFGEMTYTPDVLFHSCFKHYQGVFGDILTKIGEDRRNGVSTNTF